MTVGVNNSASVNSTNWLASSRVKIRSANSSARSDPPCSRMRA